MPIKTDDQLDLQSLDRIRERWVKGLTAVINQIRGLLLERGITMRRGRKHLEASLPQILEDAENKLSGALRTLLAQLQVEMQYLDRQIEESDQLIERIAGELEQCRRLMAIPGIGPVIATATIAAIGNGAAFKKGPGFAAWLGVVPGWCPASTPPGASSSSPVPADVGTNTCESSSSREHILSDMSGMPTIRNVWSAAVLQAKNEGDRIGLCECIRPLLE